jgi:hypothetical protein
MLVQLRRRLRGADHNRLALVIVAEAWWLLSYVSTFDSFLTVVPRWLIASVGISLEPRWLAELITAYAIMAGLGWLLTRVFDLPMGEVPQTLYSTPDHWRAVKIALLGELVMASLAGFNAILFTWMALRFFVRRGGVVVGGLRTWVAALVSVLRSQFTTRARGSRVEGAQDTTLARACALLEDTALVLPEGIRSATLSTAIDVLHERGTTAEAVWIVTHQLAVDMLNTGVRARLGLAPSCTPLAWSIARMALGGLLGAAAALGILTNLARISEWELAPLQWVAVIMFVAALVVLSGWVALSQAWKRLP